MKFLHTTAVQIAEEKGPPQLGKQNLVDQL